MMITSEQPSFREKISFGLGDFASVLYWQTFMLYLFYFYTDVFGISAAAAGTMFLVSRILDGITDPIVGMVADRTKTRWGKFRPFLIWFCVPFAVIGVMTFTTPEIADPGKIIWAYVTYNLLMIFYTIINIPYTSLLGVLSSDATQRTSLSSIKFIFAYGAGFTVSALLLPLVIILGGGKEIVPSHGAALLLDKGANIEALSAEGYTPEAIVEYMDTLDVIVRLNDPFQMAQVMEELEFNALHKAAFLADRNGISDAIEKGFDVNAMTTNGLTALHLLAVAEGGLDREVAINEQRGWQLTFVIIGVIAVLCFLITFANTRERVKPVVAARNPVLSDLKDLVTNRPWIILLLTTITFILFVATRSTVTVHYFKYFVGPQELNLPFGIMSGRYGFEILVSIFNTVGQASAIFGVVLLPFLTNMLGKKKTFMILGGIGIVSTAAFFFVQPDQVELLLFLQILGSMTGGPLSALIWAMYADTADYGEWKTGRRATGLVFSASTMSQKFGWAIGSFIAAWMLTSVGFEANMVPTEEVMQGLRLLMSFIPSAIGLLFMLLILFYPLNERRVASLQADLQSRRTDRNAETLD